MLSGVVVVVRYRFDFTIGNAKSKLPLVLESVVHRARTRSRHQRRRRKVNIMDFVFYGNVTHNDVLVSRLFWLSRPAREGRKSTRTQTRNESFGLEKWYRCFYAIQFDIDQSRDGLTRHFSRALFSSRCKNPRELFWASFKGGEEVCFLPLICVRLSHICALCARFSPRSANSRVPSQSHKHTA